MPGRGNEEILSLNVQELLISHLVSKTNCILQQGSLFFILQYILVRILRDSLIKYGRAITKSFFRYCTYYSVSGNIFSKHFHYICQPSHSSICSYTKYFLIYKIHDKI